MMDLSIWQVAIALTQSLIYFSTAACVAGIFLGQLVNGRYLAQVSMQSYIYVACVIGIVASLGLFYLTVGLTADNGLAGIFDTEIANILWQATPGTSLVIKMVSYALLLIMTLLLATDSPLFERSYTLTQFLAMCGLIYSYGIVGHVSDLGIIAKLILMAHVFLLSCWIGSLWPLLKTCQHLPGSELFRLMHKFGSHAVYAVSALIVLGLGLSVLLIDNWQGFLTSDYGRVLILKIGLVLVILTIAALNKMFFVPRLIHDNNKRQSLQLAITVELMLAILIFMVTAVLSSSVGPNH